MRDYEVVYIFRSTLSEEDVGSRLDRHHEIIEGGDGEISAVEHWGKRQLAYPIQNQENGYYVVAQFSAEPDLLPEFERRLKLDEDLLRHLIVLSEGELPTPPSARGVEEDEGEDEEDDEGEDDEGEDDEGEDEEGEDEEDEADEDEADEDEAEEDEADEDETDEEED